MKKLVAGAALCVAATVGLGVGPATAGEITGKNTRPMVVGVTPDGHTILHARSICAFSGLNDEFIEGDATANRTQSWGQLPRSVRQDIIGTDGEDHPGNACSPGGQSEL